ncbi:hypothetical protein NUU61_001775 [Penicillium alfredii]|uniref:DUF1996 domain-containing protein n=1 Tax=Penicillium alfredii TaxID=1506179 RepID=A0A9W9KG60_9EURO|nr:uncharacterized protein NUU61_001775 [Penicillium alfredii]KAJ5104428.1 hypothetical protein NUU61_001775 [Penicillium alfredii]
MQDIRLSTLFLAAFALFAPLANAFWRLPCRGRAGVARLDPIIDPGKISSHVHAVHGAGSFGMNSDQKLLLDSTCTSCAVTQDRSAYWHPALYFMHKNGSAQLVDEVGGMLAYYFLNGENIKAFPKNFRMLAGDPFQRNFTWPVPDPPKSEWSGDQVSQRALRQKALGFNCMNYQKEGERSLSRHFLPNKTYLDENCPEGVRFELMFPSCWNGKDHDSHDHKSHVAYPSQVMTGTCPEGFETRLVSLFYETIWDTYAFKDQEGYFALANGDPTGFGYHGDFMQGWDDGVLQQAVDTCTNLSGEVTDCKIFDLQSDSKQQQCQFDIPEQILHEDIHMHPDGLPGGMHINWGPGYALPAGGMSMPQPTPTSTSTGLIPGLPTLSLPGISIDPNNMLGDINGANAAQAPTTTSTSTPTPNPATSFILDPITQETIYLEREIAVLVDTKGVPFSTSTGSLRTLSTSVATSTETVSTVVQRDTIPTEGVSPDQAADHARQHAHNHRRRYGHAH